MSRRFVKGTPRPTLGWESLPVLGPIPRRRAFPWRAAFVALLLANVLLILWSRGA